MTGNNSSTGGPLSPTSAEPIDDDALDDFFQTLVVGITGLPGDTVFPAYQPDPPPLPAVGTNWAAVSVQQNNDADDFPYVSHSSTNGVGEDTLVENETLNVLVSFYGPNAKANASLLRRGLKIAQNREVLFLNQMGLVTAGPALRAPSLEKNLWLNRWDLPLVVRRASSTTYPVLDLASLAASLITIGSKTTTTNPVNAAL